MTTEELKRFFEENPLLYTTAPPEDLVQLSRIYDQYPDSVRLLSDGEAVKLDSFDCRRCGACCATVKYITVCYSDVRRWLDQKRWDIIEELAIDRTATPLLAYYGKAALMGARAEADAVLRGVDSPCSDRLHELLYITKLLESAVYVNRKNNACTFLDDEGGICSCRIHDTTPRVCQKFPYYLGSYTDGRLIHKDSFCPSLRNIAENRRTSD